mmetsp:Transcript_107525/g.304034  ORF Transcript_107525/g.304034 Transcript_107525/m.304034 type:complete len:129 (+) Transcript_107525:562-948(+)
MVFRQSFGTSGLCPNPAAGAPLAPLRRRVQGSSRGLWKGRRQILLPRVGGALTSPTASLHRAVLREDRLLAEPGPDEADLLDSVDSRLPSEELEIVARLAKLLARWRAPRRTFMPTTFPGKLLRAGAS